MEDRTEGGQQGGEEDWRRSTRVSIVLKEVKNLRGGNRTEGSQQGGEEDRWRSTRGRTVQKEAENLREQD
jgi:hypothetical protein